MFGKLALIIVSIFVMQRLVALGLFAHVVPFSRFSDCVSVEGARAHAAASPSAGAVMTRGRQARPAPRRQSSTS